MCCLRRISLLPQLLLCLSLLAISVRAQTVPALPAGFSVAGYLARNADLKTVFANDPTGAWQHYYLYGVMEGRRFDNDFQAQEYLELYADLRAGFGTDYRAALFHWFDWGRKEGRMGGVPAGFDAATYLDLNPDVKAALGTSRVKAWLHYLNYGLQEGRHDGDFIAADYLALYGDIRAAFGNNLMSAALHWYLYGRGEGRRIPPGFSVTGYFARNPDVQNVLGTDLYGAWQHYLNYGLAEGRIFSDEFRVDEYLANYADLRAAFGADRKAAMLHWIYFGRTEGRRGRLANTPTGPTTAANDAEASRFLIQATFGPKLEEIAAVRTQTFAQWIDAQMAMTPSSHLAYYQARRDEWVRLNDGNDGYGIPRQEAWWQMALTAPDQLRQRVAFALSEILVVSQDGILESYNEGCTAYYEILLRNAFGNYRQLLEEVTLSPVMGTYLSMNRNQKPNAQTGTQPDENYAREIMQLFSIGLSQLNTDGSLKLDSNGRSIPTYTQADIVGLAHVFTGWGPHFDPANPPRWNNGELARQDDWFHWGDDMLKPMTYYQKFADLQTRTIVGGVVVPNNLTGPQRLTHALDTLFAHPNVGPFLGKLLIQRLVTSNPSPAYLQRVASAFDNNGVGVRGDLGAVVRAILLDPEARRVEAMVDPRFGKLNEPLMRLTRLFRACPLGPPLYAAAGDNRLLLHMLWGMEEQNPLYSPTVFNFFKPGYTAPGAIANAGLVAPEFQILTDVTAIWAANRSFEKIFWGHYVYDYATNTGQNLTLDFSAFLAILDTSTTAKTSPEVRALFVDKLNERMMGGTMSPFLRQTILESLTGLEYYGDKAAYQSNVITVALYLVVFSPEFNITR